MNKDMNKIVVLGRIVKNPELKEVDKDNKVCNITLAVNRGYKDKEGNEVVDFLNYSLWNKLAENISKRSDKGSTILLEGYCTTKTIETDKGNISVMQPVITEYNHICKSYESVKKSLEGKDLEYTEEMEK